MEWNKSIFRSQWTDKTATTINNNQNPEQDKFGQLNMRDNNLCKDNKCWTCTWSIGDQTKGVYLSFDLNNQKKPISANCRQFLKVTKIFEHL